MGFYDTHVLPYVIDLACGISPVTRQREKVVPLARGRVLEIGIGTGRNLRHYRPAQLTELYGLDPALQMHRLARKRMQEAGIEVQLLDLPAESIPQPDASFDTVVCTYTLCTIADPMQALSEMRRVLKKDGQLLFCEHGHAPDVAVSRWQKRLNPWWAPLAGGCQLDRKIPDLLRAAGFEIEDLQSLYLPGPRPLTYNYWGVARP